VLACVALAVFERRDKLDEGFCDRLLLTATQNNAIAFKSRWRKGFSLSVRFFPNSLFAPNAIAKVENL
jgi:hypothetical protein